MIGDMITLGLGTPSSISTLVLLGLSPNPEVRSATAIALVGVYDAALPVRGWYDPSAAVTGVYDAALTLIGESDG